MDAPTKQFRHAVSLLKKQGLLPKALRNGTKLDARYAVPSWKVKGKSLASIIKKYDDVVSGKETAITVDAAKLKAFRKAGYRTSQGKVLVPHSATEKVSLRRGEVMIKAASGIERIQIPVEYHNLQQYLSDLKKNAPRIQKMKRENEYFGFRFHGFNSSQLYRDIDDAIEDITKYQSVVDANTRKLQTEVYKNFEFVKLRNPNEWVFPSERRRTMSKEYNRRRAARFRAKLKRKPQRFQDEVASGNAERMRRYRERLKKDKKAYAKYKRQARKRNSKYTTRKGIMVLKSKAGKPGKPGTRSKGKARPKPKPRSKPRPKSKPKRTR